MGILDLLFGKGKTKSKPQKEESKVHTAQLKSGDKIISAGGYIAHKVVRDLTAKQKESLEKSTIPLTIDELFMHYWRPNLVCKDKNDPEWENMVVFFWKAEEPFPKKSLPPFFEAFQKKYFLLNNSDEISHMAGETEPWFGMPGGGEKHVCMIGEEEISIPELHKRGIATYIKQVELTDDNLEILSDRDNYFFLIDARITPYRDGNFYLGGQPISISDAYSIGGIHIVKKVGLE